MSLRINSPTESLAAQRYLETTVKKYHTAVEHLSSGKRLNRAADNAAGLAVAETLSQQTRGLVVAQRNAGQAISLFSTTESGLRSQHDLLARLTVLSIQAASDTFSDADRVHIQAEVDHILDELDRIADETQLNLRHTLGGQPPRPNYDTPLQLSFHVGANKGESISFDFGTAFDRFALFGIPRGQTLDVSTRAAANLAIRDVQNGVEAISRFRARIGAITNRMEQMVYFLGLATMIQDQAVSISRIRDTDFAMETADLVRFGVLQNAGTTAIVHTLHDRRHVLSLLRF